jgi:alkaline phosphatase D
MAQITAPNLADELTPDEVARLPEFIRPYIDYTRFELPLSTDMWDGYDAERQWLCDTFRDTGATPVVLTGDSHCAWANDVLDPRSRDTAALEIGATSISSPGYTEALGISGERVNRLLTTRNPNVRFTDPAHRGFTTLALTPDGAEARYHVVDTILTHDYQASVVKTIGLRPRRGRAPVWSE